MSQELSNELKNYLICCDCVWYTLHGPDDIGDWRFYYQKCNGEMSESIPLSPLECMSVLARRNQIFDESNGFITFQEGKFC